MPEAARPPGRFWRVLAFLARGCIPFLLSGSLCHSQNFTRASICYVYGSQHMLLFPDELYEAMMVARNLNVTITSESDGTTRDNVPDWLVHMAATWVNGSGIEHSFSQDRYLLLQLNWLIQNHPAVARIVFQDLVLRIERVRQGIDDPEAII